MISKESIIETAENSKLANPHGKKVQRAGYGYSCNHVTICRFDNPVCICKYLNINMLYSS